MDFKGNISVKKFVYLAGPIAGCSNQEINLWRQKCHAGFSGGVIGISPYRAERENDDSESQKRVIMKNYMDTKNCDLILAYLPKEINYRRHSYGTTFEIAWGYSLQKPVVIVSDDIGVHDHPLMNMSGAMFWDLEEAIDHINVLLGAYSEPVEEYVSPMYDIIN